MSSPPVQAIPSDPALPESVDVAVVGGGIVGVSTCHALARKGLKVALFEKGAVGAEQSSRNWGFCRQQNRDERELPLIKASLRIWDEISRDSGIELGFRRAGIAYVTNDPATLATWEAWGKMASRYDVRCRILASAEAAAATPGSDRKWLGGASCEGDGRAETVLAAPGIAEAARKLGATIHQQCAVRGLDVSAGRVSGVITERGRVRAQSVVAAGGAWNSLFCGHHGIDLPIGLIDGTAMRTRAAPGIFDGALVTPDLCIRRRVDGGYTLALSGRGTYHITPRGLRYAPRLLRLFLQTRKGLKYHFGRTFFRGPEALGGWSNDGVSPFEKTRVLDPAPGQAIVKEAIDALHATFPQLRDVAIEQAWAGAIDTTADIIPVISPIDALPGLVVSSGFSGHGFGIGPGAGRLTADLVTGDAPIVDPHAFRYSRLVDGSDLGKPGMI
jgi:glycine/D-amino acid oxidase-like deaminating enzyme